MSGQGPNAETAEDCPNYTAIAPGTIGTKGQVVGKGCMYPSAAPTLASQFSAKHLSWRAYIEGIDEAGGRVQRARTRRSGRATRPPRCGRPPASPTRPS